MSNSGNERRRVPGGLAGKLTLVATLAAMVMSGCQEPVTTYQVPGRCISDSQTVLVLPFMDTRTFADSRDPLTPDLGNHVRDIFVAALENNPNSDAAVLAPTAPSPTVSLTNAQLAEYGRRFGADVVVSGQVFSFTETRAASIPPRAGMFVRVVSAQDGALLFVGDHYQAAGVPGASGGRDQQARLVAARLVDGIVSHTGIKNTARRRTSSASAYASLADAVQVADHIDDGLVDIDWISPEPPPIIDLASRGTSYGEEWDRQFFHQERDRDDRYTVEYGRRRVQTSNTVAAKVDPEKSSLSNQTGTVEPGQAHEDGQAAAEPEWSGAVAVAESQDDDILIAAAPPVIDSPYLGDDETASMPMPAVRPDEPDSLLSRVVESEAEAEPEIAQAAVESMTDRSGAVDVTAAMAESTPVAVPDGEVVDALQASLDELDMLMAGQYAATLSGDDLAADLFASEGVLVAESLAAAGRLPMAATEEEITVATVEAEPSPVSERDRLRQLKETVSEWVDYQEAIQAGYVILADATDSSVPAETAVTVESTAEDMADAAAAAATVDNEGELVAAADMDAVWYDDLDPLGLAPLPDDGPVVSIPLAVEQPRSFKSVDLTSRGSVESALISYNAEVQATSSLLTMPNATRVLVLPYHERINPHNLIPNTGGGEVVTTLFGSQLALNPEIQVLWDASGQTSHDRLVDREEALQLGRMVNADYVVRGQVVEFRRAQSVPSFYSAVISTAMLAAQMVFAEMSGVDVATEVYRVSDGVCVMSRRDRAQQKYVVQAEKTVRRLAAGVAASITEVVTQDASDSMDPLIDGIEPISTFGVV